MRALSVPALSALLLLASCDRPPAQPTTPLRILPTVIFEGMPLAGTDAIARKAGFTDCGEGVYGTRCKRPVTLMGVGPVVGAVDLIMPPAGGPARFDHVTLYHEHDQSALVPLGDVLKQSGWQSCLGPDAETYGRAGSKVRIAIDTNYWGKRRALISIEDGAFRPC